MKNNNKKRRRRRDVIRKRSTARLRLAPDPILSKVCSPIEEGEDVSNITRDMLYILTNSKFGVGLAANQAGYSKCVIVIKDPHDFWLCMINPEIIDVSDEMVDGIEGCLSYPRETRRIKRHKRVTVKYQYQHEGHLVELEEDFKGVTARIIEHEVGHLKGEW